MLFRSERNFSNHSANSALENDVFRNHAGPRSFPTLLTFEQHISGIEQSEQAWYVSKEQAMKLNPFSGWGQRSIGWDYCCHCPIDLGCIVVYYICYGAMYVWMLWNYMYIWMLWNFGCMDAMEF